MAKVAFRVSGCRDTRTADWTKCHLTVCHTSIDVHPVCNRQFCHPPRVVRQCRVGTWGPPNRPDVRTNRALYKFWQCCIWFFSNLL